MISRMKKIVLGLVLGLFVFATSSYTADFGLFEKSLNKKQKSEEKKKVKINQKWAEEQTVLL
jgi:hypothetical protein